MNPVVRYTLLRVGLFVAALAVLSLLGARGLLALALAAVVSLALSYVLLGAQRQAVAERLARRIEERRLAAEHGGVAQDAAYEDRLDDERRAQP